MHIILEDKPQDALIANGYHPIGGSEFHFRKCLPFERSFHAIVDYNNFVISLHIDFPIRNKGRSGTKHGTIQKNAELRREKAKIINSTFFGKLKIIENNLINRIKQSFAKEALKS